ncbi:hypothetical protein GXP67_00610 [Rhodocytophaga rosea]|uniref:Uncharacterized protein n=1 Tax=Rhodocytophaga rosea TaxID=2704465 RepID=A0A6C0GBL6_9BACT|nr:hypothetical protein [Rhodocytophaga rosea]QHT65278.1 hypothetical protein GXP67_00610 [Rhodocytophaga rosea]
MIVRLDPFLTKLEHLSYVHYHCEKIEMMLFITLYGREEMEKYIILEPVTAREYHKVATALDENLQEKSSLTFLQD